MSDGQDEGEPLWMYLVVVGALGFIAWLAMGVPSPDRIVHAFCN